MALPNYYKLDNPAWYSLEETHHQHAIGNEEVKSYKKNIVSFVALRPGLKSISNYLNQLIGSGESFFIINELPALPANYTIESKLACVQMICSVLINNPINAAIEKLGDADEREMTTLINLVQAGYYLPGTRLMGDYFGIRDNGQLVSITGERMRMDSFTEISAVVTHPEFTGRKYAQQLITHTTNKNLTVGITPFLHVAETNETAIKIYEYLGFIKRRIIFFWKIKREV